MLRSQLVRSPQHALWQLLGNRQLQPWWSINSCGSHLLGQIAASSHHPQSDSCDQQCSSWRHTPAGRPGASVRSAQTLQQQQQQQQHRSINDLQQWPQSAGAFHHQIRHYSSSYDKSALKRREEAARSKLIQYEFRSPTLGYMRDTYTGPKPWLPKELLVPVPKLWKLAKHCWRLVGSKLATQQALMTARANIPGFQEAALYDTVSTMYQRINQAQAEYRLEPIQDLVSRDVYLKLKGQMEQRKIGGWDRIVWEIEPKDKAHLHDYIKLVHGRMMKTSQHAVFEWVQLTFRIPSQQKFAAYKKRKDGRQELIAGNPDEYIDVEDYWVFEHKTVAAAGEGMNKTKQSVAGARWRLVARLNLNGPADN